MSTNISITENYQLYNDDCMSLLKKLPDSSVDMVLVDPPYGFTDAQWDKSLNWDEIWPQLKRVSKDNAAFALFASSKFVFELANTNFKEFRYKYTWVKNIATGFLNANRLPLKRSEDVCIFYKKQPVYNPQRYATDKPAMVRKDKIRDGGGYTILKATLAGCAFMTIPVFMMMY